MKRINIFVLLCIFILTMTAGAWADNEEVTVTRSNGKNANSKYATLANAVDDFEKGDSFDAIIALNKNVSLTSEIEIKPDTHKNDTNTKGESKLTINLNGHNITSTTRVFIIRSGDVTINGNGTIEGGTDNGVITLGNGTSNSTNCGFAILTVENGVTIKGNKPGIIVAGDHNALDDDNLYGQRLIFNGTIEVNAANGISNYYKNDTTYYKSTDIRIGSSAIIKVNSTGKHAGIFHPCSGDLTISSGATIEAPTPIEMKRGKATIYGGTFTSKATTADPNPTTSERDRSGVILLGANKDPAPNKNLTTGYAVASIQNDALHNAANITIKGGEFKGYIAILDVNDTSTRPAKESDITVTGGKFSSNDVEYFVPKTVSVTKQGDWYVVGTAASTTPTTAKEVTASVSGNTIKYEVTPAGSTASLSEVLAKVADKTTLSKVTTLNLDSQISSTVTASDLKSLTELKKLTVSSASSVSGVDLTDSTVTEFNAPNASKLTSLTVKGNKTIQTLDVSGSGLTTLDASNCSALKTVNAKGGKLESVNFTGTKLTDLNVSGNKLTQLDLTGQTLAASKANFSGQATTKSYTLAKEMNFAQLMGLSSLKAKIKAIYEILNGIEIQSGYYDPDDGTVTFDETPKNSLKYYYDTGVTISSSSNKADEASLAAGESAAYMDVTVSGGTAAEEKEEEEATTASSSSGCEAGLGLGALAALAIFAKKR